MKQHPTYYQNTAVQLRFTGQSNGPYPHRIVVTLDYYGGTAEQCIADARKTFPESEWEAVAVETPEGKW